MQNAHSIMNIMHENNVNLVGEVGAKRPCHENGKLWPKELSSESPESLGNSLGTA